MSRRNRQPDDSQAAAATSSPPSHPSKRLKTTATSHVPGPTGLGFLVDEDARNGHKVEAKLTNGVPDPKTTRVDDSRAVVAPDDPGDVASSPESADGDSSDDDFETSDDSEQQEASEPAGKALVNGHSNNEADEVAEDDAASSSAEAALGASDVAMADAGNQNEDDGPPSFGDMLQNLHPDPIDVTASHSRAATSAQALVPTSGDRSVLSGTSLTAVLTQALKTNDKALLETCFHTKDVPSIRATIQRLPSAYVGTLLQRLAERIHKRPGRTGNLLVWVQWALVAHGGYLAQRQPEVVKELQALERVLRERAMGLQPLLHLKGKLDLLAAQLELRRGMMVKERVDEDGEVEGGVVYVEGQEEDWEDSSDDDQEVLPLGDATAAPRGFNLGRKLQTETPLSERSDAGESESESDGMPNGVVQEDDSDSEVEDEEQGEGLLDDEAEETSDDEGDAESSADEGASEGDDDDDVETSDAESEESGVQPADPKMLHRNR